MEDVRAVAVSAKKHRNDEEHTRFTARCRVELIARTKYGTLGLMVIKTLEALGPLHGYRIARRIEQISGNQLALNQGTLYPALLKLQQMGWISSKWGTSETGRRVRIYALTPAGRKQIHKEEAQWQRAASIVERFLKISENPS